MFTQDTHGMFRASLFSQVRGLIHGFSSRSLGDGRKDSVKQSIYEALDVSGPMIMGSQPHGNLVVTVSDRSAKTIPGVDGLICLSENKRVFPAVLTADCVPLLFVDPDLRTVAAAHAGWRGTKDNIAGKTVAGMRRGGSNPAHILVSIGPHIGMCCYTVPKERSDIFVSMYPGDIKVASYYQDAWHLDIGWVNYRQLQDAGITSDHIDAPLVCTSCQIGKFYSYRKDTKESFGEMVSFIGWKQDRG